MARIAFAGFQHETNIFAPGETVLSDFEIADSWPEMLHAEAADTGTRGLNLPIAGAIAAARAAGDDVVALLWCAAEPGGPVTDVAFEAIMDHLLGGLRGAGPLDAIYLDLHGAMVTQSHIDGESAVLARVRAAHPGVPIALSLDLHANLGARSVEIADVVTIYRTYPHLDMAETGARAIALLHHHLTRGPLERVHLEVPFLLPLPAQHSGSAPLEGVYARLKEMSNGRDCSADVALGFSAADGPHVGVSVVAQAPERAQAMAMAQEVHNLLEAAEGAFDAAMLSPREAVTRALAGPGRCVIADVQDNAGAGATSDTMGLLKALVAAGAKGAVLGLVAEADTAQAACAAGVGATLKVTLGGRSGWPGDTAWQGSARVDTIGPGSCTYTGEMYGGGTAVLGHTAVLHITQNGADIRVVVCAARSQALDRALFEHLGLDLTAARIIALKSTLHYRADFDALADLRLTCAAPGCFPCDLTTVPYRDLRAGLRLGPMGPPFAR